jgi:hypothetical protein
MPKRIKVVAKGKARSIRPLKEKQRGVSQKRQLPAALEPAPMPKTIAPGEGGCMVKPKGKNVCLDVGGKLRPPRASEKLRAFSPGSADSDDASGRAGFFAANLKNVCRVKKVSAMCIVPSTAESEKPKKMENVFGKNAATKAGKEARTEEEKKAVCESAGGLFRGSFEVPLRVGKTELDFLSKAQAKALQSKAQAGGANIPVLPGANLRLCFADKNPGVLIPVESPAAAVRRRDEFQSLIASGKSPKEAAIELGRKVTRIGKSQQPALGGRRSRRSRRR